jgi:hypothetical protein
MVKAQKKLDMFYVDVLKVKQNTASDWQQRSISFCIVMNPSKEACRGQVSNISFLETKTSRASEILPCEF